MIRRLLAAASLVLISGAAVAAPAAAPAAPFNDAQKAAIDDAVKQYIMDNPQVMISSVEAYYNKQNATKKAQEGPLTSFPAGLLDFPGTPTIGPKTAKVSVVEFFDYNCGYCKQVASDVERLSQEDKTVRIVFKDLPILSDTSEVAARYALAANKQGKYLPYHLALLQHQGPITEALLVETAKSLGIDTDKLKKDANTQDVRDVLNKNLDLARELGVRGTPFFVIGKQKIPGAIGFSRMKEIIAQESGLSPAAATAAPTPAATAPIPAPVPDVKVPEVKTDAITPDAAAAKPDTSSDSDVTDPEAKAEIDKARAEARAMIDEIRDEAKKMQAQAVEAQKAATDAAASKKAAEDAAAKAKK